MESSLVKKEARCPACRNRKAFCSCSSDVMKEPDGPGYYWWRGRDGEEWVLSEVIIEDVTGIKMAKFFNGSRISGRFWGQWRKAEVK
jgi:hypothetical protein